MTAIIILTFFVLLVAVFILSELIESKNGSLRKILIAYFSVEILMFAIVLYFAMKYEFPEIVKNAFFIILIPKSIVKAIFFFHLNKK